MMIHWAKYEKVAVLHMEELVTSRAQGYSEPYSNTPIKLRSCDKSSLDGKSNSYQESRVKRNVKC